MQAELLAAGAAFTVTGVSAVPIGAFARTVGLVDRPGALKVHRTPVPYLGGAAVLAGLLAAASARLLGAAFPVAVLWVVVAAFALGVADDGWNLPVGVRLVGQVGVGLVVASTVSTRMGAPGWPAVVAVTVLLVNAVNLVDGLDGLAAGVGAAAAAGFALLLGGSGRLLGLALAGALAGFLVHNRPPARIYLGDGGAYVIGGCLAVLVCLGWQSGVPASTSAASLLLVAYPVAEVVCAVIRRRRAGTSLMAGDRDHSYDVLVTRGWPVGVVSLACALGQAVLGGLGLAASDAGPVTAALIVLLAGGALLSGAAVAGFLGPRSDRRPG